VVADDVHEVRTTMALRTARTVLAHAGAFRRFFLGYFDGEWDFEEPKGRLPIILTATQKEYIERARAYSGREPPERAAAFYIWTTGALDPCFVTFEARQVNGAVSKLGMEGLLVPLEHEIGHQLAYEYSKHLADRSRAPVHQHWAVEGVANFMPCYDVDQSGWTLSHSARRPHAEGGGSSEGPFAWTKRNRATLLPVAQFIKIPKDQFLTVENYHYAATLTYFLLEGAERRYREGAIALLAAVHQIRDTEDLVATCFPGVTPETLQGDFDAFLEALVIEPVKRR
jgi:hypothetical protein